MPIQRPDYQIETYLQRHSSEAAPLYQRYVINRTRLQPIYSFWAAGFPGGNDHGWGHIDRVLAKLDMILSNDNINRITLAELFLSMISILYHDWGILNQRKDHPDIGAALVEAEREFDHFTPVERDVVVAAVASHGSKADIREKTNALPQEVDVAEDVVRPRVVAALVRLSDELDEDERRAPDHVPAIKALGPGSEFYWRFCQRIPGIRPNPAKQEIHCSIRFEKSDLKHMVSVDGVRRSFFGAFGEKLEKINRERRVVQPFLPQGISFERVVTTVAGIKGVSGFEQPRTIVLDDYSTAGDFVRAVPELTTPLFNDLLSDGLRALKQKHNSDARASFSTLYELRRDIPDGTFLRVLYDLACVTNRQAEAASGHERTTYAQESIAYLKEWIDFGFSGHWEASALIPENELHRMVRDPDLSFLTFQHRADVKVLFPSMYHHVFPPEEHRPAYSGSGGCVARGTLLLTPSGVKSVETLREGDLVLGFGYDSDGEQDCSPVRLARVLTSRGSEAVWVNGSLVSRRQPILCADGQWRRADQLREGIEVQAPSGEPEEVKLVRRARGYFEFFDLSIASYPHTFATDRLICHNKYPAHLLDLLWHT